MNKGLRFLFAAIIVMTSIAAFGGPPVSMEKLRVSDGPFIDPVLMDWCGVEILVSFDMKGKVIVFEDFTTTQHINYDWTMFNPVTDKTVIETGAFSVTTPPVMELVDEDLGTLTLIFEDTIKGLAFKWRQPGVGVLLRDAGVITYQLTLVFDMDTTALIDEDFNIFGKGPHPYSFMSQPDAAAIICGALTG